MTQDKYKLLVRAAKDELTQKYAQYMQITKERTVPVEAKSRKYAAIDIEATKKRLEERMSRFSIPVFCFIDDINPVPRVEYFGVVFNENAFRFIQAEMPLETDRLGVKINGLKFYSTQLIVSNHALERWLERNDSTDYKEALYQLGDSLVAMNHQLLSKQYIDQEEVYGHLERQVECRDSGIAIIKVENPEHNLLRDRIATVVTYINSDMVNAWNERKAREKFSNVSDIPWKESLPEPIQSAMDSISEILKADEGCQRY